MDGEIDRRFSGRRGFAFDGGRLVPFRVCNSPVRAWKVAGAAFTGTAQLIVAISSALSSCSFKRHRLTRREVIRRIRRTRKLAARAAIILTQLGEGEAKTSLRIRFRRLCHTFDASSASPASAALFHELSLVIHTLNLQLSEWFYPV